MLVADGGWGGPVVEDVGVGPVGGEGEALHPQGVVLVSYRCLDGALSTTAAVHGSLYWPCGAVGSDITIRSSLQV